MSVAFVSERGANLILSFWIWGAGSSASAFCGALPGHVQLGGGGTFGALTSAVVSGGGVGVGVAGELLDGGQVHPGVEQVADGGAGPEGTPVVRGEFGEPSLAGAALEHVTDGLRVEPRWLDATPFVDTVEERAGFVSSDV